MNYEHRKLLRKYVEQEKSLIAFKEERRLQEELLLFIDFVEEKEIDLKELPELKDLDKSRLVEYFLLIREKRADNDQAIDKHIRTVQRFLHYLKDSGYIKEEDSPDRVKEEPGVYACA